MNAEILAIVPARGGSKGIPRKNLRQLAGRSLLSYTAEAALKSKNISRVVLSSDDEEIRELGTKLGLDVPFIRPFEIAQDNTPMIPVLQHALNTLWENESYKPDLIVLLQPTSPLRTNMHVDRAICDFLEAKADSLVSVVQLPHNYNPCLLYTSPSPRD